MSTLRFPLGGTDPAVALRSLAMLPGDPSVRLAPGRVERASPTPEGVGSIAATWEPGGEEVRVETWGDGSAWLADRAPGLLGLADDVSGFAPTAPGLRELWRRFRGDRIPATGTLWHDLPAFIVQQRVSRADAAAQWRRLVTDRGPVAPGLPHLRVPPAPAELGRLEYHDLHRYGIERQRAAAMIAAARASVRLTAAPDLPADRALAALAAVPGVGPWTLGCLRTQTWGEADAVIPGDYGIPSMVSWLLAREARADDERMLTLLEPHRPHRYRVIRLAFLGGVRPPRRGPRVAAQDIRRR